MPGRLTVIDGFATYLPVVESPIVRVNILFLQ